MAGDRTRAALVLVVAVAVGLSGCSGDDNASSTASKAASALASKGAEMLASAGAEARRRLDEVRNGLDAKGEVKIGTPATASDGRTTVGVTVTNTADSAKSFAVQVSFKDSGGSLLDTVVVTVGDVAAGRSAAATARSTHKLSGAVKAEVERALRY